jgi:hypothetical protein
MKLFSLSNLQQQAVETFRRFPLSILSALTGTILFILVIYRLNAGADDWQFLRTGMSCYLCMLFSISVVLYSERFTFSRAKKLMTLILAVALGVVYYMLLPDEFREKEALRFVLFTSGLHLLVAFSPFLVHGEMNGMWQFNKSIFLRILAAAIYSGVLYAGLALAMLAVDQLFDIKIRGEYYGYLWVTIAGLFNTWFFLAGVPENIPSLNDETDYPKGLKVFTMYVLLPLITIYMVILYLYAGKILITGNWPVGWVGYMVIAFAIFGILSFLLIYPLREDESNMWVKSYSKLFYFLLIVPIVLLFTAIFKRINQYGITEERYLVLVLAFWLSFVTLYLILSGGKNIRIIPASLCVVAFLSAVGPWGAFSVSHRSQFRELTRLLESNHVLVNAKADTVKTHDVASEEYERIKNIVRYISHFHGRDKLQELFDLNLDSLAIEDKKNSFTSLGETNLIIDLLKLKKIESADQNGNRYFRINNEEKLLHQCSGYDFIKTISLNSETESIEFFSEADTVTLSFDSETGTVRFSCRNLEPLVLETREMLSGLSDSGDDTVPPEMLMLETDNAQWKAKIIFTTVNCSREQGKLQIDYANGLFLLKINSSAENEIGEQGSR